MRKLAVLLFALGLAACGYSSQFGTSHTAPLTPLGSADVLSTGSGSISLQGDEIVMPEQIEFDTNKSTIRDTEQSQRVLGQLLLLLKAHPNITRLRIEGHTDSTGGRAHNNK